MSDRNKENPYLNAYLRHVRQIPYKNHPIFDRERNPHVDASDPTLHPAVRRQAEERDATKQQFAEYTAKIVEDADLSDFSKALFERRMAAMEEVNDAIDDSLLNSLRRRLDELK
jgi:patatin-like phospholipase/acyl hydrolase